MTEGIPWDNPTLLGDLDSSWNHPWSCPMVDSAGTTLLEYLQDLDAPLIEPTIKFNSKFNLI